MSWRGEEGGIDAAKQNHDVIMTPGNWCYFDHYQDTTSKTEPLAIGGFTPVSEVYGYEPVPPQLSGAEANHVLGAQANVWTEYIPTAEHVEYMVYPRAVAMAEVLWTPKEKRNYNDFLKRMGTHFKRLDERKVNYAKHILKDVEKVGNSGSH
jgi:hexosaminidase